MALVLGANLGTAINPLLEAGMRGDPARRRLPVGNMLNRLVGVLIVLPLLEGRSRARWLVLAARRRQDDGRVPHAVQRGAGRDLHRAAP